MWANYIFNKNLFKHMYEHMGNGNENGNENLKKLRCKNSQNFLSQINTNLNNCA